MENQDLSSEKHLLSSFRAHFASVYSEFVESSEHLGHLDKREIDRRDSRLH